MVINKELIGLAVPKRIGRRRRRKRSARVSHHESMWGSYLSIETCARTLDEILYVFIQQRSILLDGQGNDSSPVLDANGVRVSCSCAGRIMR